MSYQEQTKFGSWKQTSHSTETIFDPPYDSQFIGPFQWTEWVAKEDVGARDWRRIIASGQNATTEMSGSGHHEYEFSEGFAQESYKYPDLPGLDGSLITRGVLAPLSPSDAAGYSFDSDDLVTAKNQAFARLYSDLARVENAFKGMVFAGELRESLQMIRRPARALREGLDDYFRALKKRAPRNISQRRRKDIVASTWLEYAFGWKPLVSDIDSAIDQFYSSKLVRPIFQMVRGQGKVENMNLREAVTGTVIGVPLYASILRIDNLIVKLYGVYTSNGSGCKNLHQSGWNPTEFIPTLWELIPYSFLVDYFTNIGDIVSSWSYRFLGLNFLSQTVVDMSTASAVDYTIAEKASTAETSYSYIMSPGSSRMTRRSFVRTPSVALEVPSLELQVPGFGSTKWLNMAALASTMRSSRGFFRS